MSKRGRTAGLLVVGIAAALLMLSPGDGPAEPQRALASVSAGASSSAWSGAIVVENHGIAAASVLVNFYSTAGVLVKSYPLPSPVPPKGSVAVNTSAIPDLPDGFAGSAVVSSSQSVSALFVAFDAANASVDRTIYTGFAAGSSSVFVPAISNAYADQTSTLVVQNVESGAVSVTIKYYDRFTGALSATVTDAIPANASHYYDSANLPAGQQLTPPWSGAALIQVADGKNVVAAVHQPYLSANKAVAFEGTAAASLEVYLPSALFQYAVQKQTTFIAVQNTQANPVAITITFYNRAGASVGSVSGTIDGFRKQSWNPGSAGLGAGFIGSAIVRASGPVAAVVNIGSETDLAMAYTGISAGSLKFALPYIRWAPQSQASEWRTYIAVMNVDQTGPANVTINYYDLNGALVHTAPLTNVAPNTKGNHNPGQFVGSGSFAGSVEVTADRPVVGLVNAISVDERLSASYTGIPIP